MASFQPDPFLFIHKSTFLFGRVSASVYYCYVPQAQWSSYCLTHFTKPLVCVCECVRERERRTSIEEEGRSGGFDCVGGGNWILNCVFSLYDLRWVHNRQERLPDWSERGYLPYSTEFYALMDRYHHAPSSTQIRTEPTLPRNPWTCLNMFWLSLSCSFFPAVTCQT